MSAQLAINSISFAMANAPSRDLNLFTSMRPEWALAHLGEHVLIKDDRLVSFYPTRIEALTAGFELFPGEDFFVDEVTEEEIVLEFLSAGLDE